MVFANVTLDLGRNVGTDRKAAAYNAWPWFGFEQAI